ncbi:MAG: hypothetical protein QM754_13890 [Tepidisphaeraceae bacterium]
MRTIIDYAPFLDFTKFWAERGRWPAKWISHPGAVGTAAVVQAFRRVFHVDEPQTVRIHVSADERYELFLDGQRVGRGPERGDRRNWFFETYDLPLTAGEHTIVARSWWLGEFGPAPFAQVSGRPAFVLAAEGVPAEWLNTGVAPWEAKLLTGYRHVPPGVTWGTGSKVHVVGREFPWGFERGDGDDWSPPRELGWAFDAHQLIDQPQFPVLKPATLPPMLELPLFAGVARHVQELATAADEKSIVHAADHLPVEAEAWSLFLAGKSSLVVPANTARRVIVDFENYFCAFLDLVTSGGRGAVIQTAWAESLYLPNAEENSYGHARVKGNRDDIEGKFFIGVGDTFEPDGGTHRAFQNLWWAAGRYLEIVVTTGDEPLTLERLSLRETHYPLDWKSRFDCGDARLAELTPIAQRAMEMCAHETYMDCPFYEQMMYVGDTRLECLVTYAATPDDRLPRKALRLYDESRKSPGFTQSRYPSRLEQTIAPFSAWWVAMVHDYALWRDDAAFVRGLLPGVRAVLGTFDRYKTADGLVAGPPGWNFIDWVPGWRNGMPIDADVGGVSAPLNFKLAWVYRQAAELEAAFGEPELAALNRRRGEGIANAAVAAFWNDGRGLLADDLKQTAFSEHTQCLVLLGNAVAGDQKSRLTAGLFEDAGLARATIYFSHYLFETCGLAGRVDRLFDRLSLWFDHKPMGLKTTVEMPEPTRSDCHAWVLTRCSISMRRSWAFGRRGWGFRPCQSARNSGRCDGQKER